MSYSRHAKRGEGYLGLTISSTVCFLVYLSHEHNADTPSLWRQIDALDVYLPLLCDASTQTCISIALLLANSIRLPAYRAAVSEWLPPPERHKEVKGKRGWEKAENPKSPSRSGGWVARQLTTMLHRKDAKVQ